MGYYDALKALDFGDVASESEEDLDKRFVRTADFNNFLEPKKWLVLGAKGTGKSALFELFTKYGSVASSLADGKLDDVIVAAGTGYSDLSSVATRDIADLKGEDGYDHDSLWRLYIAIRGAMAISDLESVPAGPVKDLLRLLGKRRDFRIGPLLKKLWVLAVGAPPSSVEVSIQGNSVRLAAGDRELDTITLLEDVNSALAAEGKHLWLLFDKVDEIFPADRGERKAALEGLVTAVMGVRRQFSRIQPKVFLRSDLWRELNFTNKSHLSDKSMKLSWSTDQLLLLLLKRGLAVPAVKRYVSNGFPKVGEVGQVEELTKQERQRALGYLFPDAVYSGPNEAEFISWLAARVEDSQGTVLPREAILYGNLCKEIQVERDRDAYLDPEAADSTSSESLVSPKTARDAFRVLSEKRCETYFAEFEDLRPHFARFEGQTVAVFERAQLDNLFKGLKPEGSSLLQELHDIGVLKPVGGTVSTASRFEIPRLYRPGMGLIIRGRD